MLKGLVKICLCLALLTHGFAAETGHQPNATDAVNVPQLINYQGMLTDEGGNPVNGIRDMVFELYTSPTGGTPFWSEVQYSVPVTNGIFNVMLGRNIPITNMPDGPYVFLQVTVGSTTITPRIQIGTVPYAFCASKAGNADNLGNRAASEYIYVDSVVTGTVNVTVGTPVLIPLDVQNVSETPHLWVCNAYPTQNAWYTVTGQAEIIIMDAGTNLYRSFIKITHYTNPPTTMNYRYVAKRLKTN